MLSGHAEIASRPEIDFDRGTMVCPVCADCLLATPCAGGDTERSAYFAGNVGRALEEALQT
jgi:hypothetical protein